MRGRGEVSLAHHGVLFLDELPEFSPQALDSLRQPLETGVRCRVARQPPGHLPRPLPARGRDEPLPLRPRHGAGLRLQARTQRQMHGAVPGRLSGPFLDRIDLAIEVPAVSAADLVLPPPAEGSAEVARRVAAARARQAIRFAALGLDDVALNASAPAHVIEAAARPDAGGAALLRDAADRMRLTARGFHRTLKVARTIADLDGAADVGRIHLAEALSYRAMHERIAA